MLLFFLPLLAGCATPAPAFLGAERRDVTVGGIAFTVYRDGSSAEVIRRGYLGRAARAGVRPLIYEAAEVATGCRAIPGSLVTGLHGDTGEGRLRLDCRRAGGAGHAGG